MKNIKGYYSWIHSLNAASIDAHLKGREMLAEAKNAQNPIKVGIDPSGYEGAAGMFAKERSKDVLVRAKDVGKTSEEIYKAIKAQKEQIGTDDPRSAEAQAAIFQASAPVAKDSKPRGDLNRDGRVDGNDSEFDAEDGAIGDEIPAAIKRDIDVSLVKPSSAIAAQARSEAGFPLPGDEKVLRDAELRDLERQYEEERDLRREMGLPSSETPRMRRLGESVTSKIKRLMNEESAEGMSMDTATPQTSSLRGSMEGLEPPVGIFRELKGSARHSERDRIKHLISIIEDPENHPEHYVKYAHNFFQNMSRFLNKP